MNKTLNDAEVKAQVRGEFLTRRRSTIDQILVSDTHQEMRQVLLDELKEWCRRRHKADLIIDLLMVVEKLLDHH